jgi:phosphoenolpyruvate carboxylase
MNARSKDVSEPKERETQDGPLRENVKLLGSLLGDVIFETCGKSIFDGIESVRKQAKIARAQAEPDYSELRRFLATYDDDAACKIARGFAHFLNLANIAEQVHRIRRRRSYALQAEHAPQRGSMEATIDSLIASGHSRESIYESLCGTNVELILTAHPTEVARRTLIKKHNTIARLLLDRDGAANDTQAQRALVAALRTEIKSAWLTDEIIRKKPTPLEEARSGLSVIEQTLWEVIPEYCRNLDNVLKAKTGNTIPITESPVGIGSWMGGDRDGNPFVTPEVTREVCFLSRWMAFQLYERDLKSLHDDLSISAANSELKTLAAGHREPYRYVIKQLRRAIAELSQNDEQRARKTKSTENSVSSSLISEKDFLERLLLLHTSLCESGASDIANGQLYNLIKRFCTFGFALARLDIRQEAAKHAEALDEVTRSSGLGSYLAWNESERVEFLLRELASQRPLINPRIQFSDETKAVLGAFSVIEEFGPSSFGAYVISMASNPSDILAVELLQKEICGKRMLRVVPLFETEHDLTQSTATMTALFSMSAYLERIDKKQEVMIGYSDSAKDAGRLGAAWALYGAQERLVALCKQFGVHLTLFHGRGGTVGRGGGPLYLAILSQPPGSVNKTLRVTEQGEMIQAKFGLSGIALRNIDLYVAATLSATLEGGISPKPAWRETMNHLAGVSIAAYRQLIAETPSFIDYFEAVTPIAELARLNIGSRPAKRRSSSDVRSLRAIPWIFAWTQNRNMLPVWLGVGEALAAGLNSEHRDRLVTMAKEWPFLSSTLALIEMVIAKADIRIAKSYEDSLLAPDSPLRALGAEVHKRFATTETTLMAVLGANELLQSNSVLKRSIRVRNPYVDPINFVQIDLLRRLRAGDASESLRDALMVTINGISAGMRNTG